LLPGVAGVDLQETNDMCGIAGFVLRGADADQARLVAMCDEIRHRGPDDEGYYTDGPCAIGMRRLSIIDLDTGHQPMSNEDATIWVVFNGEIYNYQSIRAQLINQGHQFQTASDTETLVHLYEQEGVGGLEKLRGMFAFAIWDKPRGRLLLARDRFGKKPLYYAALPHGLYFASEMKSLRVAGMPLDIDREALQLYFQFNYIPDPHSAFKAIRKLPAGCWMTYGVDGQVSQGRYWRLPAPHGEPPELSEEQYSARLVELFDEAVRMRMIADVPLGAFLSGGLDSSSIVAAMALQSNEPVRTFSIGFEEAAFNELNYAALVAKKYHTNHHEIIVKPDSVSLVEKLVRHFDEPFADSAAIPTFIVSEFAAKHVKVALTGDGGDELFGGYKSFQTIQRRRRFDRVPSLAKRLASSVADALPYSAYGKNYLRMASRPTALQRYFEGSYNPYFLRKRLLLPDYMLPARSELLLRDYLLSDEVDVLLQAMYFEATANLTGDMLVKADRMSMANSLEVRSPLLDHELAEFAAKVPPSLKIRNGSGKYIMSRALGNRLPPELLTRPKMGFGVPLAAWFRGPLREMVWDTLTGGRLDQRGVVAPAFLSQLLTEHDTSRRDNSDVIWSLLMLELWFLSLERR
jgi:asparagine synthase (glutamine-hydrolysing)